MTAIDGATDVVEEFVDGIEPSGRGIGLALVALLAGAGIGSGLTYFLTRRNLKFKFAQIADEEIAEMREHYLAKGRAMEAEKGKGDLATIVKEKGYKSEQPDVSSSPPMAVQPPASVVDAEKAEETPDDSAMAENEVEGPDGVRPQVRNVFREREVTVPYEWDQHAELRRRSPTTPYVIHHDERFDMDGYNEVSYTYYAADDVLCNERDEVVDPAERDELIGEANLERFGHGSPDPSIVHIRNDNLELVIEVIKSPNSFAEEVHGFSHEAWDRGNLEKMRRRERDVEG